MKAKECLASFCISVIALSLNLMAQVTGDDFNEANTISYLGQKPPGLVPEIFAPGIVSTEMYNHSSVSISPDGKEIYWAMAELDKPKKIYYSAKENASWSEPRIIEFTKEEDGDCPVISPDGSKMFFNSNRKINESSGRRERIWCVDRVNGNWGIPFPLGMQINGSHLHWQISIDRHDNLYFGSERDGSAGKDDIFYSQYKEGIYEEPLSLPAGINSTRHESTPFVDPDGEYLIFARDGLWISYQGADGNWSEAISMGGLFDGVCPYVSPDKKHLFFLKMGMGYNDVYWVSASIIEELKK